MVPERDSASAFGNWREDTGRRPRGFPRVSAALGMRRENYFRQRLRLHEKDGNATTITA